MTLLCPIHQQPARFRATSEHIYQGHDYGPIWECPALACDAICGCHPDGSPLGTLANRALRQLRRQAHAKFDALWRPWEAQKAAYPESTAVHGKLRYLMRTRTYEWLAHHMGRARAETHIAMMDTTEVLQVLAILDEHQPTPITIRTWCKQRISNAPIDQTHQRQQ